MSAIEFEPWQKIARLNREIVITEKIDGTNAAIVIVPKGDIDFDGHYHQLIAEVDDFFVFAQSRTRFITPLDDNYGFAKWVAANAPTLVEYLGEGRHYGEWWGAGIQRKYGFIGSDKRFSLFNVARWGDIDVNDIVGLHVVPMLYRGQFDTWVVDSVMRELRRYGSVAAPGFMRPEGVVIYHTAARQLFKVTLEGDDAPKGPEGHRLDQS